MFALRKFFGVFKPSDFITDKIKLESTHLDFGCGTQPRNPFYARNLLSVDIFRASPLIPTHLIKLGEPLPFSDNFFTSVSAYDVVEHLSRDSERGNDFIFYMKELHRVLMPGGIAVIVFPAFPYRDAFSDPTHINYITSRTIDYFVGNATEPFYAGIDTNFSVKVNRPLRFWRNWFPVEKLLHSDKDARRKLSLAKRDLLRTIFPQHRIWILCKEN